MIIRSTCRRCLTSSRTYSTSHQENPQTAPQHPPTTCAKLPSRSLIALHGIDAPHFLQGITTNNILPSQKTGIYSAFLTAQGRVPHDVFIYPITHSSTYTSRLPTKLSAQDPAYIIEVDANEQSNLIKHIKKYKLRAKFDVRPLAQGEWDAWSLWHGDEGWSPTLPLESKKHPIFNSDIGCTDTRAPDMGYRSILPSNPNSDSNFPNDSTLDLAAKAYRIRRYMKGVPEGQREILRETALPAESNIDYMGGIDFRKGCYVGQELTIRTHHTGVVRKRILPVRLYRPGSPVPQLYSQASSSFGEVEGRDGLSLPPMGANISKVGNEKRGRSAGKWLDGVGSLGLALCRLEVMTDTVLTGETGLWNPEQEFRILREGEVEGGDAEEVRVKAFVPEWHKHRGVLGVKE